jgi:hypothetical protein
VQPEDDYDIGSDALDRLTAHSLTAGCIAGLRVEQHPNGDDFVVIELLRERQAEFAHAIREALGQIPLSSTRFSPAMAFCTLRHHPGRVGGHVAEMPEGDDRSCDGTLVGRSEPMSVPSTNGADERIPPSSTV